MNIVKFQPRVDGDFFPKDYVELIKKAPQKPAMIGFTDAESALFSKIFNRDVNFVFIAEWLVCWSINLLVFSNRIKNFEFS